MGLILYDNFIEVYHLHHGGNTEYFYLRSKPDWDVIIGYLDLSAERPKETVLQDPQMRVHFDIGETDDPIVAVRRHFRAWNAETGETLRSSSDSGSAGGLHGLSPTQAQLLFDMPVSELTVWMSGRDSDSRTAVELNVRDGCFFLPLKHHSAHYEVDVIYQPYNGIQYEASYVFVVEYPD